jgi:charged multivesicular body protein 5
MATVDAMKVANKEMKKQYKGIDIDKIEVSGIGILRADLVLIIFQSIHYDMEDLIEQANEIQESLGRSYGVPDEVDEADLQAGQFACSDCIIAFITDPRSQSSTLLVWMTS